MELVLYLYATDQEWVLDHDIADLIRDQIIRKLKLDSGTKHMKGKDPDSDAQLITVFLTKKDATKEDIEHAKEYMDDVKKFWVRLRDYEIQSNISVGTEHDLQ